MPWAELGRALGIPTPVMDGLVTLASDVNRIDYRREGLTRAKMGLACRHPSALEQHQHDGIPDGSRG